MRDTMKGLKEAITAEFYKVGDDIRVVYNLKRMRIQDFLKMAKYDSNANRLLAALKHKINKEFFNGSVIDFINLNFGEYSDRFDVIIKNRTDGGDELDMVQFDTSEMLPRFAASVRRRIDSVRTKDINEFLSDFITDVNISMELRIKAKEIYTQINTS